MSSPSGAPSREAAVVPGVLFMYASRVRAQLSGILLRYRQPLGEKGPIYSASNLLARLRTRVGRTDEAVETDAGDTNDDSGILKIILKISIPPPHHRRTPPVPGSSLALVGVSSLTQRLRNHASGAARSESARSRASAGPAAN